MLSLSRLLRVNIDKGNKGLTLIELLIVIAIVAIIAAIALPIILNILFTTKTAATTTSTKSVAGFPGQWTQVGQTVTYVPPNDPTLGQKYGGGLIAFTDTNGNGVYDSGEPIIAHIQGGNASMNATPNWNAPPPPVVTQPNANCDTTVPNISPGQTTCVSFLGFGTNRTLCFAMSGYTNPGPQFYGDLGVQFTIISDSGAYEATNPPQLQSTLSYPFTNACVGYGSNVGVTGYQYPVGQTPANYGFALNYGPTGGQILNDPWYINVANAVSGGGSGSTTTHTSIAFQTDFEGGAPTTWNDTVSSNGGTSNVSSPQMHVVSTPLAHSGSNALMYSGTGTATGSSYAYMGVYDLSSNNIVVGSNTQLSYWIYPVSSTASSSVHGANSSCAAVDMTFTGGADLRDSGAIASINGVANVTQQHPAYMCGQLVLDSWNHVTVNLSGVRSGYQITALNVGYDNPSSAGGYLGYVDDIVISNN